MSPQPALWEYFSFRLLWPSPLHTMKAKHYERLVLAIHRWAKWLTTLSNFKLKREGNWDKVSCSWGWSWTPDFPVSTSQTLRFYRHKPSHPALKFKISTQSNLRQLLVVQWNNWSHLAVEKAWKIPRGRKIEEYFKYFTKITLKVTVLGCLLFLSLL